MKNGKKRILILDEIRGFAIICMVFHHIIYDIGFVLGFEWGNRLFNSLCIFQPLFWAAFIITSGICSRMSRNSVKRGIIVLASGFAVTIVTAVIMPAMKITGAEIYFGVLSCLGCCMITAGLLMPVIDKTNEIAGMLAMAFMFFAVYNISKGNLLFGLIKLPEKLYELKFLFPIGIVSKGFKSADYFPLFPWMFMFLFGAFFGKYAKEERLPEPAYKSHSKLLQLAGKNSLWIYLIHQPAIYAVMYVIKIFL